MGIFSRKKKASPQNSLSTSRPFFFGRSSSDVSVNERTALATTGVYACVRIISEAIACLPLNLEKHDGNGSRIATEHPLHDVLYTMPNVEMTSFIFRETIMSHLLLWGNGYAQIIRDNSGRVKYLYPLMPNKMDVWRDDNGEIFYTYYRNRDEKRPADFKAKDGGITLRREDVLHFKGLGFDGLVGYSPIAIARNAIGMSIAAENYGATFFANGANPSGVLEHPEGLGKDSTLDIRETWNALYRGSGNHSIAVLDDGLKFKAITIPPDQAQFLETRKYQLGEIARIFGVPPHMIADLERATFSNIEHQSIEFVTRTINPWVKRLEQCMDLALLSPAERKHYSIRFNLDAMLRGDYKTRMEGYKIGRQNGWLSANDIRDLEHMNPIPAEDGGDKYFVNANMVELKQAGFFTEKKGEN